MTLSDIFASLRVVGNISRTGRYWDLRGYLSLEGFQDHLLELVDLIGAQAFVGGVCELLCLEADAGVELHFEPLTAIRLDPLAVDALVLVTGPGVPEFVQLKALALQMSDVRPDALSIVDLSVLKGVPDRVRDN
jgi:hypothetical protein